MSEEKKFEKVLEEAEKLERLQTRAGRRFSIEERNELNILSE